MFGEEEFIIHVCCLICEYYNRLYPFGVRQRGFCPRFSDPEALTVAIVGEYIGLENDSALYEYFRRHYPDWFPHLPERSILIRQRNSLWQVKHRIWQTVVWESGQRKDPVQIIDTVPVPVCHPKRASRKRIFPDDPLYTPDHGYCASKQWYCFGFKGGIRLSLNGMIVRAPIPQARTHDAELLGDLTDGVPSGTVILGDKGFTDGEKQQNHHLSSRILIRTPLRKGMKDRVLFKSHPSESRVRRLIGTVNGQLVERFHVQKIRARKGRTLAAKWYRKIPTHTVCVFTNLLYGRNPTQPESLVS